MTGEDAASVAYLEGTRASEDEDGRARGGANVVVFARGTTCSYSTVTVFARFRGWSMFSPRRRAIW